MSDDQVVVFITLSRKGKFRPMVATVTPNPGDTDSPLWVIAKGDICATVEEAARYIEQHPVEGARVFLKPVKPCMPPVIWLSEIEHPDCNPDADFAPACEPDGSSGPDEVKKLEGFL